MECHRFATANEIMALGFGHQWQTTTHRDPYLWTKAVLPSPQIRPESNQTLRYYSQLIGDAKKRSMGTTSEECAHKNTRLWKAVQIYDMTHFLPTKNYEEKSKDGLIMWRHLKYWPMKLTQGPYLDPGLWDLQKKWKSEQCIHDVKESVIISKHDNGTMAFVGLQKENNPSFERIHTNHQFSFLHLWLSPFPTLLLLLQWLWWSQNTAAFPEDSIGNWDATPFPSTITPLIMYPVPLLFHSPGQQWHTVYLIILFTAFLSVNSPD